MIIDIYFGGGGSSPYLLQYGSYATTILKRLIWYFQYGLWKWCQHQVSKGFTTQVKIYYASIFNCGNRKKGLCLVWYILKGAGKKIYQLEKIYGMIIRLIFFVIIRHGYIVKSWNISQIILLIINIQSAEKMYGWLFPVATFQLT